ncbi:30S ribosomal protein S1 [Coxiella endosymbiont of Amblyomma americanum]|uniref:30S ribosomal protein S1 n=1 Tax=Coxiella endosymbiont of Amblyomma americanum TaxID=325775 RepID=UPI00057FD474|nr:30S ribosomal protein S1 [Coxiella endosymbiont of Amblyomma americanum]AJC50648.1 30S ribosomal protein S1 [Coxiella endosymbiont of Amblyomma americanum]
MGESFADLFEKSLEKTNLRSGALVKATVVEVKPNWVVVDAGLKSEGVIPTAEFHCEEIQVGNKVDVVIDTPDNGFGETRLSREKARRIKMWEKLEKAYATEELVRGKIVERVKGGFTVEIQTIRAFLPGSLVDTRPVRNPDSLRGTECDFKIIKMDRHRNNVVVSRRAVVEAVSNAGRQARLENLQEGQEINGVVKNITDYGAFIDLGGIDGLLHITDIAWKRIKHPSELLNIGDEVRVKILKFDRDRDRVSLGMKQLSDDPWLNIAQRYPINTKVFGRVTNVTDYGCFVQLEDGAEGLVHASELDWTNKNIHPSKVVQSGTDVEVMILSIDEERRRISLGIKQCKPNPWKEFAKKHQKDEEIIGKVRSITDFGIFIGLEGDIDGLVHISDLSWSENTEEVIRRYKKGDDVKAVILAIDPERERIALGIKQLEENPTEEFLKKYGKDTIIQARIKEVESKQAILELDHQVFGRMHVSDYAYDHVQDLTEKLNVGDKIAVKIIKLDYKDHLIQVSHKTAVKLSDEESQGAAMTIISPDISKGTTTLGTLGDLLKEQMRNKELDK